MGTGCDFQITSHFTSCILIVQASLCPGDLGSLSRGPSLTWVPRDNTGPRSRRSQDGQSGGGGGPSGSGTWPGCRPHHHEFTWLAGWLISGDLPSGEELGGDHVCALLTTESGRAITEPPGLRVQSKLINIDQGDVFNK